MDWRAVSEQQEPVAWSRLYRRVSDERDALRDAARTAAKQLELYGYKPEASDLLEAIEQ